MKPRYLIDAEDGVRRALKQFREYDIDLSYVPTVRPAYGDHDCDDADAAVRGENPEGVFKVISENPRLSAEHWKKGYGLDVTFEAMEEFLHNQTTLLEMLSREATDSCSIRPGEIVLYRSFRKPVSRKSRNYRNYTMAHECWHLVEQEKGVFGDTPIIIEGTATYVAFFLDGKSVPKHQPNNSVDLVYRIPGRFIQDACCGLANPLQKILDKEFRSEINRHYSEYLENLPVDTILSSFKIEDPDMIRFLREQNFIPQDTTPQAILEWYRNTGGYKLASEIEGQDLSKLTEFFSQIY